MAKKASSHKNRRTSMSPVAERLAPFTVPTPSTEILALFTFTLLFIKKNVFSFYWVFNWLVSSVEFEPGMTKNVSAVILTRPTKGRCG